MMVLGAIILSPLLVIAKQLITNHQEIASLTITTMVWILGRVLSWWKRRRLLSYGVMEAAFGLAVTFYTLQHIAPDFDLAKVLTVVSCIYIVSRGVSNIADEKDKRLARTKVASA
jgi:uncharacterized membrane protein YfcA